LKHVLDLVNSRSSPLKVRHCRPAPPPVPSEVVCFPFPEVFFPLLTFIYPPPLVRSVLDSSPSGYRRCSLHFPLISPSPFLCPTLWPVLSRLGLLLGLSSARILPFFRFFLNPLILFLRWSPSFTFGTISFFFQASVHFVLAFRG